MKFARLIMSCLSVACLTVQPAESHEQAVDTASTPGQNHGANEAQSESEGVDVEVATTEPATGEDSYPVRVRDIGDLENEVVVEDDVAVVVRDGTRLSAKVFRPNRDGAFPVIMSFTAYGKDAGPDQYPPVLDNSKLPDFDMGTFAVSPWATWEGPDPAYWVPHGYAVIFVDVRGFFSSTGKAGVLSEQDAKDFYDAVEWAAAQEWSNGRVGLIGVSYLAISQWVAAGSNPPHLNAIVPWEGQTDAFREVLYHGGIPETAFTRYWLQRVNSSANEPPLPALPAFQLLHPNPQMLRQVQPPPAIHLDRVTVPALICASWSDHGLHSRGSFEAYKQISSEQKWLFTHGRPKWSAFYSEEALDAQKRFLDHFLSGSDNGMEKVQSVRLEVRETLDEYQVRYEDSWPIARTIYRQLYLDASSGLLQGEMSSQAASASYDPLSEAAIFTVKFDRDTELTGNMKLKLWVSTSEGSDMDIFVGVKKLDVRKKEVHFYAKTGYKRGPVAMGWLRASERDLDEARSTPWQPVLTHKRPLPVSPGEAVPVDIEILPSSTLFRKGESLQLVVQGTDLFKHPMLAHSYSSKVNQGTHSIHTGGEYDSHLLIPVVP